MTRGIAALLAAVAMVGLVSCSESGVAAPNTAVQAPTTSAVPAPVSDAPADVGFDVQISDQSEQILQRMLAVRNTTDPADLADVLSREFLGTPYGAHTLVGSETEPETLVVELGNVDCFTYADYVETLKRARDRDEFLHALVGVRYKDDAVGFLTRKHFFSDWSAMAPALATDVTKSLSANAIQVAKMLNQRDDGGVYLPGLPTVPRTITYIPSEFVDDAVRGGLRTGDYIGAYAPDGGLDVTHVGIFIDTPSGPVFRNASSLSAYSVVDEPFHDYVRSVPGIVVLRPVI